MGPIEGLLKPMIAPADALSEAMGADVLFLSGNLGIEAARELITKCNKREKKKDVLLILVTSGGDGDAAYKIARHLQNKYGKFSIFVPGWCKSAGTLIVSGAHDIYMSDLAELGPLDIQLSKKDDIFVRGSGLNVEATIKALEQISQNMYFDYLYEIKFRHPSVRFKAASEVAVNLIGNLLAPIYGQIEPTEIGESSRAMEIAKNYAARLHQHCDNFKGEESLDYLVGSYPDHGFVIDRKEAQLLFKRVNVPTPEMQIVENSLKDFAFLPVDTGHKNEGKFEIHYLSSEPARKLAVATGA